MINRQPVIDKVAECLTEAGLVVWQPDGSKLQVETLTSVMLVEFHQPRERVKEDWERRAKQGGNTNDKFDAGGLND